MKKNLLIAIALAMALSAYFASCCKGYDTFNDISNASLSFEIHDYHSNRSMIGFGGYPKDNIKFSKSGIMLQKGQPNVGDAQVLFYYVDDAGADIKTDSTYTSSLYVTYPVMPNLKLPYGGETDTIKCVYHAYRDKCKGTRADVVKFYFNDSLYYNGLDNNNLIFYKN